MKNIPKKPKALAGQPSEATQPKAAGGVMVPGALCLVLGVGLAK